MLTADADVLAQDYYVQNFHRLAGFVMETYVDLLSPEERDWYQALQQASEPAQRLYIRLLTRKGSIFRLDRLNYPEIHSIGSAAVELANAGLADTAPPSELGFLLAAYTKPQLLDRLDAERSLPRSRSRADLVEYWLATEGDQRRNLIQLLQSGKDWITLSGHQFWNVYRLCFFGNLYQDGTEFVLEALGTVRYERYALTEDARAFSSRAQLLAHLRHFECQVLLETVDRKDADSLLALVEQLPDDTLQDAHLGRRVDRFRNRVARQLERLQRTAEAHELYRQSLHPPARERRIRMYLAEDRLDEAGNLLQQLQDSPVNDAEAQVGLRLQQQLERSLGRTPDRRRRYRPSTTTLTLHNDSRRVELAARDFHAGSGVCHYSENVLVNAVLGLFIWDIIFHPIPGAFFNPFQMAPSDFRQPEFVQRRAELLKQRLQELDDGAAFRERVQANHEVKRGIANPLVRWTHLEPAMLNGALERIPRAHWRVLFERMLSDLRENTSGFPDLVLFGNEGGYEFIEIKGPGDTLQQNQIRWMQYFDQHGIPCRVVLVRWADDAQTGE